MAISYWESETEAWRFANSEGLFRPGQLIERGVAAGCIELITEKNRVRRYAPGVYGLAEVVYPRAVCATVKWPRCVVAGLSALHLHELCAEPLVVSLAIDARAKIPLNQELKFDWSRTRGLNPQGNIQTLRFKNVVVPVFSPARALFDCLRSLERQPLPLVQAALKTALEAGHVTREAICRLGSARRNRRSVEAAFDWLVRAELLPLLNPAECLYEAPPPPLPPSASHVDYVRAELNRKQSVVAYRLWTPRPLPTSPFYRAPNGHS